MTEGSYTTSDIPLKMADIVVLISGCPGNPGIMGNPNGPESNNLKTLGHNKVTIVIVGFSGLSCQIFHIRQYQKDF